MGDLLSWLLSFFLLVAVLAAVLYQVMCLLDLENDYVNPYDSASEINILVVPEFVLQGALCFLHLVMGHWLMCLICLPYLYYDVKVYTDRRHLLDVTEIFNQLPWEKKIRLYKLGYLGDDLEHCSRMKNEELLIPPRFRSSLSTGWHLHKKKDGGH